MLLGKNELENSLVLRQTFMHFPDVFLKLQVCSLEKVLEFFICALPQISVRVDGLKGVCWQLQKTRPRTCLLALVGLHSVCCYFVS